MVLTLYKMDASPPARAAMMVLDLLNLPAEYIDVNLLEKEHLSDEYLKMNPQHTIPVLKDDDFVLADSHAIAGYLVSKYAKDDSLYPQEPQSRAIIDHRLHFDSGILFPSLRYTVAPIVFFGAKEIASDNLEKIKSSYEFSEKFLTKQWMAGDEFTIADICCYASLSSLNEIVPVDSDKYPNLVSWLQRCSELEFCKKKNEAGAKQLGALVRGMLA
ncbi:glutathione S-transferase 1-like [Zerene cesonia]|uniref:glutathione S-transferase 1-like n=1 Tax=Zerene cesonia TaxID=33412 RepID=UPI0018E52AB2|nr:glutathione S-transferase 1-like [Zerene cesonia]